MISIQKMSAALAAVRARMESEAKTGGPTGSATPRVAESAKSLASNPNIAELQDVVRELRLGRNSGVMLGNNVVLTEAGLKELLATERTYDYGEGCESDKRSELTIEFSPLTDVQNPDSVLRMACKLLKEAEKSGALPSDRLVTTQSNGSQFWRGIRDPVHKPIVLRIPDFMVLQRASAIAEERPSSKAIRQYLQKHEEKRHLATVDAAAGRIPNPEDWR